MTAYLAALVAVALVAALARGWYRRALAQQAVDDATALQQYRMGTTFSSPAMAAKYDQSIVTAKQRSRVAAAAHARAKSRKAQAQVAPKVTSIRRAR